MLLESDWTANPQIAMSDEKKAEWTSYRQSLRDIPQIADDLDNIVWPIKPN